MLPFGVGWAIVIKEWFSCALQHTEYLAIAFSAIISYNSQEKIRLDIIWMRKAKPNKSRS
jgi:hypothetical protein